jgi:hypothetical protein
MREEVSRSTEEIGKRRRGQVYIKKCWHMEGEEER